MSTLTSRMPSSESAPAVQGEAELFAAALHQGRNIVMSTRGYAELIARREISAEKQDEWVGRIVQNLDRLEELYCGLEQIGKLDASTGDPVSLALAVDCACRLASAKLRRRGTEAHFDLELGADPILVTRGQLFSRAVAAFVENAIEADPSNTARVQLVRDEDGGWRLSIQDHGPGMSEQDRERLGKSFFTRKTGRMGMGAYMGRTLLHRLGMNFTVTTVPAVGTRVMIQPRRGR